MNKNEKLFINTIKNFSKKLKIRQPIIASNKALQKYLAITRKGKLNKKAIYLIIYNPKTMSKLSKTEILNCSYHEVGHMITDGKTKEIREYKAEKIAIKAIKKYHPMYYKRVLKLLERYAKSELNTYQRIFTRIIKEQK